MRSVCSPRLRAILLVGLLIGGLSGPPGGAARSDTTSTPPHEALPPDVVIETVVPNAEQLVAMAFTPDGRLLYTEKSGRLRVVVNDQLLPTPAYFFQSLNIEGERGLLGLAVDPEFAVNNRLWVYLTRDRGVGSTPRFENRVVTFILPPDNIVTETQRAYGFPVDRYITIHNGGNLHFAPDGKLMVSVGNNNATNDAGDPAQDLSSRLGKLHRFTPGVPLSIPTDNPLPGSLYARGLRNAFDFDFDPVSGVIFATENGEACDDELNRILPGYNYGWRPFYPPPPCDDYDGADPAYNTIQPVYFWTTSVAPTGLTFYDGNLIPEWRNDLFVCAYKESATAIHHFKLNAARTAIVSHTILSDTINHQPIKCRTDLLTGPDGALYYSEGGGYPGNNGPIKRLIRRATFLGSGITPSASTGQAGGTADFQIDLRHRGAVLNSFALTVTAPPPATVLYAHSPAGELNVTPSNVFWSGLMTGTLTWTMTYRLQFADTPTTPYALRGEVALTSPGLTSLAFAPLIVVNGRVTYLPIGLRD